MTLRSVSGNRDEGGTDTFGESHLPHLFIDAGTRFGGHPRFSFLTCTTRRLGADEIDATAVRVREEIGTK